MNIHITLVWNNASQIRNSTFIFVLCFSDYVFHYDFRLCDCKASHP